MTNKPVYVTQPDLPPLAEFIPYLEEIWSSKVLTNGGRFHQELESALCKYLGVEHISLFSNGTIALITALQALRISGEVITTPYSFVATAHSLLWNGIEPVFVDIDSKTMNLDPKKIEAAITNKTTAIMPVHCYGYPCDTQAIQEIADQYNLKLIYDAAHAFGVKDKNGSILRHGDLSILSFHATKVFNTFEGGAIVCPDRKTKEHIDHLKNFGFVNETTVVAAGINGKMNEVQSAMGLLQLKYIDAAIKKRKLIDGFYRKNLASIPGIKCMSMVQNQGGNFSYFPIFIDEDFPLTRDELYQKLKERNIFTRRYFYPLISEFPMYRNLSSSKLLSNSNAKIASMRVLCLPIYPDLCPEAQQAIVELIAEECLAVLN